MIEREFINQKTKEFYIKKYIEDSLKGVGISQIKLQKIPLGEKIIIFTNRPSLIVGSKGANIRDLTKVLKTKFKLENPQIEINEVKDIFLDAKIVAQRIAGSLERFGSARFKGIGHKVMENVLNSGALGVEIIISGKLPSARARSWRFYQGYLKKCGEIAETGVRKAQASALLKSGVVGVKVAIMPPDIILPDHIEILSEPVQIIEVVQDEKKPSSKKSTSSKGKSRKKSAPKKKAKEKEEEKVNITTEAVVSETISAPETTSTPQQEQKEESDENN
ncbi:30S ribosomal protein S3 [Candidatus Woesearchaeota archaeon]|nr:30S ribosomal protein S3 [Candidatus Woesearchaeota archaeon]